MTRASTKLGNLRNALFLNALAAAFATSAAAAGAPSGPSEPAPPSVTRDPQVASVVTEEPEAVVLRLDAPAVSWTQTSGYLYPKVKGFGTSTEAARPALPVRVVRVGVPAGASPELTILESDSAAGPAGRVGPVQTWQPLLPGSDESVPVNVEDASVYESRDWYPAEAPVRLGEIGSLREQRYVEVIFTPVLASPGHANTLVYRSVTVRVDFRGGAAASLAGALPDPDFESVYTAGIVNAKQASRFRGALAGTAADSAVTAAPLVQFSPEATNRYKLTVNRNMLKLSKAL